MRENRYRSAVVLFRDEEVGTLKEIENEYLFEYSEKSISNNKSISASLPVRKEPYKSERLFPFFEGLVPEGWYLYLVCATLKIDSNDIFGILLATCKDSIGAVSIKEIK